MIDALLLLFFFPIGLVLAVAAATLLFIFATSPIRLALLVIQGYKETVKELGSFANIMIAVDITAMLAALVLALVRLGA